MATDDLTVVMKVKKPSPIMLHLYVYILPEHIWKDIDEKEVKSFANEPGPDGLVGSGPFRSCEHKKGQFIRLEANKSYYKGAPQGRRARLPGLPERGLAGPGAASAVRSTSPTSLDANVFDSLKDVEGVKTFPAAYSGFDEIAFNTGAALDDGTPIGDGHPALKDVKLRQALSYAIDNKTLVDRVLGGYGDAGQQLHPAAVQVAALRPGRDARTRSTRRRPRRCSTRPATQVGRTASAPCRTATQAAAVPAVRPAATRRPASRPWSSSPAG